MKTKPLKSSSTRRISNNFSNNLYNNFLGWNFSLYTTTSPIGFKWKLSKTKKIPRNSIIDTLSLEYFAIKSFSRNLDKGNNQGVFTWKMHGGP
jgi:hypothetical protein